MSTPTCELLCRRALGIRSFQREVQATSSSPEPSSCPMTFGYHLSIGYMGCTHAPWAQLRPLHQLSFYYQQHFSPVVIMTRTSSYQNCREWHYSQCFPCSTILSDPPNNTTHVVYSYFHCTGKAAVSERLRHLSSATQLGHSRSFFHPGSVMPKPIIFAFAICSS